jgi:hypothetical protein
MHNHLMACTLLIVLYNRSTPCRPLSTELDSLWHLVSTYGPNGHVPHIRVGQTICRIGLAVIRLRMYRTVGYTALMPMPLSSAAHHSAAALTESLQFSKVSMV